MAVFARQVAIHFGDHIRSPMPHEGSHAHRIHAVEHSEGAEAMANEVRTYVRRQLGFHLESLDLQAERVSRPGLAVAICEHKFRFQFSPQQVHELRHRRR